MHDLLRERILRSLETLPEAQLYQVVDYIEFLGSKYAQRAARAPNAVQRFGDRLEDKMRAQGVAMGTIRGTLGVMGTASRLVSGITEASRSVMREMEAAVLPPPSAEPRRGDPRPAERTDQERGPAGEGGTPPA